MFITEKIISIFAPHTCILCDTEGLVLCGWCSQEAFYSVPPRCYRCRAASAESATCKKCRSGSVLSNVWVFTEYGGVSREVLRRLKFGRAQAAAQDIARALDDVVPFLAPDTVITHVPTATSRVRMRGYDQSRLIAKEFARLRSLPYRSLLLRIGQARQVGSTRVERARQVDGAFRLLRRIPEKVLLIDDVVTTGATIESAAKLLKTHGAKKVHAAVFAQKQ